ncbi:putative pentatricopeptide repeat-containing protein At1g03510 [Nicotiana tomentosiformis]|uniref:putative pentatricopeptide repeat-containing protein At1g03510 n=1 Tax=Nicotiana tomentosiformis TaxID=4098 RepID=UPI00051C0ABE|nr:putative pentatricopeptide repeat-containing protein At1g03510 [Nicotiana tomentosiformis]
MSTYSSNFLRLLSHTKLLTSHVNQGRHEQALSLFHQIHSSLSLSLDPFVFPLALKSCAALNFSQLGTTIHAHTYKASFTSNPFVACALVDMYGKCISLASARQLFDEYPERNVVVWNSMISLYAHSNDVDSALELFRVMDVAPNSSTFNVIIAALAETDDGFSKAILCYRKMERMGLRPNLITVLALLRACIGIADVNLIKQIHGYSIRNDIDPDPQLKSGLIEAYGRCGCLDKAHHVFVSMRNRDVVAWSSLISAYALQGQARIALEVFKEMEMANVRPDGITFLGVLKACSHAGLADEAQMYFARMRDRYGAEASSDHYACLVDVLSRAGRLHQAYDVIRRMPVKVTAKAWGALLASCRTYGEVELAEIAGRALFEVEPENPANFVILARIYATSGRFEEAEGLRREMIKRGMKAAPGSSWVVHQD